MTAVEELSAEIRYDGATGQLWWLRRGLGRRFSKPVGWVNDKGYVCVEFKGKAYKATHLIWLLKTGAFPIGQIDHKDGIKNNNMWGNLREANQSQQTANTKTRVDNVCGLKGIHKRKGYKRWRAQIVHNKRRYYLGDFGSAEEAHAAYVKAAKKYHGEFARV